MSTFKVNDDEATATLRTSIMCIVNFEHISKIFPVFSLLTLKKYLQIQPAFTCSMLTIETLEQGVKYVQS